MDEIIIGSVICNSNYEVGLAFMNLKCPILRLKQISDNRLYSETLQSISECDKIIFPHAHSENRLYQLLRDTISTILVPRNQFSEGTGMERITQVSIKSLDQRDLELRHLARAACAALLSYLESTEDCTFEPKSLRIQLEGASRGRMWIDPVTVRNLELISHRGSITNGSQKRLGLLDSVNYTNTQPGQRFLRSQIISPLVIPDEILQRQRLVSHLIENNDTFEGISQLLSKFHDTDQIVSHFATKPKKVTTNILLRETKTAIRLREVLDMIPKLIPLIERVPEMEPHMERLLDPALPKLLKSIEEKVSENCMTRKGMEEQRLEAIYCIRENVDPVIDLARIRYASCIDAMKDYTNSLKDANIQLKFTSARGYFLKAPLTNANHSQFIQCVRRKASLECTTETLAALNLRQQYTLKEILLRTEHHLKSLRVAVKNSLVTLLNLTESIAFIDFICSIAKFSKSLAKPRFADTIHIVNGYHAVLRHSLQKEDVQPNSFNLQSTLGVVTGPNNSGKSTLLKQVATTAILAQIGSHVPAESCTIPIFHRISSRIGNEDNLESNASTFSLEMTELSSLLATTNITPQLVLMDELGRGTSSKEGAAIAVAVAEFLSSCPQVYTLFTTHFSEMCFVDATHLQFNRPIQPGMQNTLCETHRISENNQNHASVMYGIKLAESSGMLPSIIENAKTFHSELIHDFHKRQAKQRHFASLLQHIEMLHLDQMRDALSDI